MKPRTQSSDVADQISAAGSEAGLAQTSTFARSHRIIRRRPRNNMIISVGDDVWQSQPDRAIVHVCSLPPPTNHLSPNQITLNRLSVEMLPFQNVQNATGEALMREATQPLLVLLKAPADISTLPR